MSYKLDGQHKEYTNLPCIGHMLSLVPPIKITDLVVELKLLPEYEQYQGTCLGIAKELDLTSFSSNYDSVSKILTLEFSNDIHYEEFYAIVSLFRLMTANENNYLLDRGKRMRNSLTGDASWFFYMAHMFGYADNFLVVSPVSNGHNFIHALPGNYEYIKQWRSRLGPGTILSNMQCSMRSVNVQRFFSGDTLSPIYNTPAYNNLFRQLVMDCFKKGTFDTLYQFRYNDVILVGDQYEFKPKKETAKSFSHW